MMKINIPTWPARFGRRTPPMAPRAGYPKRRAAESRRHVASTSLLETIVRATRGLV